MKKPKKYQAGGSTAKRPWIDVQERAIAGKSFADKAKSGAKMPPKNNKRGT